MHPLVSCILPTNNRAGLIGLAINSYLSQTYLNKQLIVLDSGDDGTQALIPKNPTICYERVGGNPTTGIMRNICCSIAEGEFIAHFDSDDWSAAGRIESQVQQLVAGVVMVGYHDMLFYDKRNGQGYRWNISSQRFALGTSLVYRRSWWETHQFDDLRVGEDYKFFQDALRGSSGQVLTPSVEKMMVALVHNGQTSGKNVESGNYHKITQSEFPKEFFCSLTSSVT